jgi:hypothetical protein
MADYFDRARIVSIVVLAIAAAVAITGSVLDWSTAGELPRLPESQFEDDVERPEPSESFTGVDAGDGVVVIAAGAVMALCALMLGIRRRGLWAGIALVCSLVIGAVGIASYRGIGDIDSAISRKMNVIGEVDPAIGVLMVAVAGLLGLLGAVLGLVATPSERA